MQEHRQFQAESNTSSGTSGATITMTAAYNAVPPEQLPEIASVVALEAFDWLDAPPTKITGKDVPMPYAANLEKLALPHVDDIVAAAKAVCYRD